MNPCLRTPWAAACLLGALRHRVALLLLTVVGKACREVITVQACKGAAAHARHVGRILRRRPSGEGWSGLDGNPSAHGGRLLGQSPSTAGDASTEGFFGELEAGGPSGGSPTQRLMQPGGGSPSGWGRGRASAFAPASEHLCGPLGGAQLGEGGPGAGPSPRAGAASDTTGSPDRDGAGTAGPAGPGSAAIAIGARRSGSPDPGIGGQGAGDRLHDAGSLGGSGHELVNNESLGFDERAVFDTLAAHARHVSLSLQGANFTTLKGPATALAARALVRMMSQ